MKTNLLKVRVTRKTENETTIRSSFMVDPFSPSSSSMVGSKLNWVEFSSLYWLFSIFVPAGLSVCNHSVKNGRDNCCGKLEMFCLHLSSPDLEKDYWQLCRIFLRHRQLSKTWRCIGMIIVKASEKRVIGEKVKTHIRYWKFKKFLFFFQPQTLEVLTLLFNEKIIKDYTN